MEVVVVWSMLIWNEARKPPTDRLAVTTTDNHYQTESGCWDAANCVISFSPKARVACVQTRLTRAELEAMEKLQGIARKALRDFPDAPKP